MARRAATSTSSPAGESKGAIGLLVLDFTNPFFADVARGTELAAREAGYTTVLAQSRGSEEQEAEVLASLVELGVKGIIITPAKEGLRYLDRIRRKGIPVVLLDRAGREEGACAVAVDNVMGGHLVGQHLVKGGHERFGLVTGPTSIRQCVERADGFRQALEEAGIDSEDAVEEIIVPAMNQMEGRWAADRLLAAKEPPTAVFCLNDLLALGAMRGFSERGTRVPDDVAVAGYDDLEFVSSLQTPLTTVRQPKSELGRAAAELLIKELGAGERHQHTTKSFRPQLVARESTG